MGQFTRRPEPILLLILVTALATPAFAQTDQRTLAIQEFDALLAVYLEDAHTVGFVSAEALRGN
jgi:hypothetical protein